MMRVVYKLTGPYADSERSYVIRRVDGKLVFPLDIDLVMGANVMGRFGGTPADYVVLETDEPSPHLLRYVDGELVIDQVKLDAIAAAETAAAVVTARREVLAGKVHAQIATLKELQEFVAGPGPE